MRKIILLVLIFIMVIPHIVFATNKDFGFIPDLKAIGRKPLNPPVQVERKRDDNKEFEFISYVISSTGAGSGIRYRTSEIRIVVAGHVYRLNTLELQQMVPKAGETVHSLITINTQHIIAGMNKERKRNGLEPLSESEIDNIKNSLNDPSKIEIEANIDIYNKATGKVLDRITDINNIAHIAGKHGFSKKHIEDMKSRYRNKPLTNDNNNPLTPNGGPGEIIPKKGLRPTGIRE